MNNTKWRIEGFETNAGNRIVQKWYWNKLDDDERDAIRDRMNYLTNLPRTLWAEKRFTWFSEYGFGEVRIKRPQGPLRIYGYFPSNENVFVFLEGHYKEKNNDRAGKRTVEQRLNALRKGQGRTHEFDFEDKSGEEGPEVEGLPDTDGGLQSHRGNRLPN